MTDTLSVLLPIFNEQAELEACLGRVLASPVASQIVAVDDCSTDGTPDILLRFRDPRLCVVRHERNCGKGGAIQTALEHATGSLVIIQDADTEYDPADYALLLAALQTRNSRDRVRPAVVYGVRDTSGQPLIGHLGNRFLTLATNMLCGTRLRDMETCYKLVPTMLMRELHLQSHGFEIEPEITVKLARRGVEFLQVPVSYKPREAKKLRRVRDGIRSLTALFRFRFRA